MAFARLPKEWIPTVQLGNILYQHYPIQELTRSEAERILKQVVNKSQIVLRTSENARQTSPTVYYVATYFINGRMDSVNTIITREQHCAADGQLNQLLILPMDYSLVILPHSPFFAMTTETMTTETMTTETMTTETAIHLTDVKSSSESHVTTEE